MHLLHDPDGVLGVVIGQHTYWLFSTPEVYAAHGDPRLGFVDAVNPIVSVAVGGERLPDDYRWVAGLARKEGLVLHGIHDVRLENCGFRFYALLGNGPDAWIKDYHPLLGEDLSTLVDGTHGAFERYTPPLASVPFPVGAGGEFAIVKRRPGSSEDFGAFLARYLCQPPAPSGPGW